MAEVQKFTIEFLNTIDDDADGGLSLNELKNNEMKTTNQMFQKAAIWLASGRNFQRFDRRGIGIIDEMALYEVSHSLWTRLSTV